VMTWFLFYSGFYVLQILLAALTLGTFRWEVLLLASNSFPIYVKALQNAYTGVNTKWHVTGTTDRKSSAFNFIIPQVLTFVFLFGTSIVSVWRDINQGQLNVATFWSIVNAVAIGAFIVVGFREARAVAGVADPTAVDLATAMVEQEAALPLSRAQITQAHKVAKDLAKAPLDQPLPDLGGDESSPRRVAEPLPTDLTK
jgi:cellulose synthase (UDP-forming)